MAAPAEGESATGPTEYRRPTWPTAAELVVPAATQALGEVRNGGKLKPEHSTKVFVRKKLTLEAGFCEKALYTRIRAIILHWKPDIK